MCNIPLSPIFRVPHPLHIIKFTTYSILLVCCKWPFKQQNSFTRGQKVKQSHGEEQEASNHIFYQIISLSKTKIDPCGLSPIACYLMNIKIPICQLALLWLAICLVFTIGMVFFFSVLGDALIYFNLVITDSHHFS